MRLALPLAALLLPLAACRAPHRPGGTLPTALAREDCLIVQFAPPPPLVYRWQGDGARLYGMWSVSWPGPRGEEMVAWWVEPRSGTPADSGALARVVAHGYGALIVDAEGDGDLPVSAGLPGSAALDAVVRPDGGVTLTLHPSAAWVLFRRARPDTVRLYWNAADTAYQRFVPVRYPP